MRTGPESEPLPKEQILQAAHETLHELDREQTLARRQDTAERKTSTLLLKLCGLVLIGFGLLALGFVLHQHLSRTADSQTHETH